MKTNANYKVQSLILGSIGFGGGIVLLSVNTLYTTVLSTLTILITGLTSLIIGIYFLLEYVKLTMLPESEEIDMMKDEEIEQLMEEIENMEPMYFHHDPKMRMLYEELGEKVMERYRLRIGDDIE